jgi:hypothetical protein
MGFFKGILFFQTTFSFLLICGLHIFSIWIQFCGLF